MFKDAIRSPGPLCACLLALIAVAAAFLWQGATGFNLWDEGYLWYGSQRILEGDVPLRDFMAYDPGRYYWSAAIMALLGDDGIMAQRFAVMLFQIAGLGAGLLILSRHAAQRCVAFLLAGAFILLLWMFPRHKVFDISLSLLLVGNIAFFLQRPTLRRSFFCGAGVGLIAAFGRNHGLYGAAGSALAMLWIWLHDRHSFVHMLKTGLLWGCGIVAGYAPVLLMLAIVPGFAEAMWESIRFLFEIKATNLPLPTPWPWRADLGDGLTMAALRQMVTGLFFIGIVLFGIGSLVWVFVRAIRRQPVNPAFAAAAFLSLPYAHYAFSRADTGHLAQGIFPFLIGVLVFPGSHRSFMHSIFIVALLAATICVTLPQHPGRVCQHDQNCVTMEISGDTLLVEPAVAEDITLLRELAARYAPQPDQTFIVTPFWPGAYPLLGRKAPMWEIYALFPHPTAFEEREIARMKAAKPRFAFVFDYPIDGREDLRYAQTHPLTAQYINTHFEPLPPVENPFYKIYRAKE